VAKGAGNQGGKGKGGKGRGPTQRSQDYLARYGYPSSRELRREAEGLAGASVPSIRSVSQPYNRQAQSARDFLSAVQAVLGETQGQVGAAYDQATASQGALDAATQQRLAGLGLGVDSAGVQAAQGARGDSASANLLSNEASAKSFAAAQPGIAAGNTGVVLAGLRKQQTDALSNRRDQLRQSFFQALGQVQSQALARAGFNQSADQFHQQMAASNAANALSQANTNRSFNEQVREFNISRKDAKKAQTAAGLSPSEYRQQAKLVADYTGGSAAQTTKIPVYKTVNGKQQVVGYKSTTVQGSGTPNVALQGQGFTHVLNALVQQGVNPAVALPMLQSLYTDPILKHAPVGTDQWKAYQSYLRYIDPQYGHHPYEGEHGQTFVP
jgi:hypothetical protein